MKVYSKHFDESENADDLDVASSSYTIVNIREGEMELEFRIYDHSPTEAICMSISKAETRTEVKYHSDGCFRRRIPKNYPLLKAAMTHLHENMGIRRLSIYDGRKGCYSAVSMRPFIERQLNPDNH